MKRKDFKGKSKCPFCSGSKIKPFIGTYVSQNCKFCDKEGLVKNTKLYDYDLIEFIEKN